MQFLDFLQQKFIVFQSSSVPLFTCIFFAEKAKRISSRSFGTIGAGLEVLVFRRLFSWGVFLFMVKGQKYSYENDCTSPDSPEASGGNPFVAVPRLREPQKIETDSGISS